MLWKVSVPYNSSSSSSLSPSQSNAILLQKKLVILYTAWIIVPEVQRTEIEKFSDRSKSNSTLKRDSLAQILQLTSRNFPEELVEGMQSLISQRGMRVILRLSVCLPQSFLSGATYVYRYSTVKFSGFKGKLQTKRKVQWNPGSGLLGQ